ncbi:MAG: tetratricopeptide repeat protein, partial [Planctomycetota bacterium]
MSLENDITKLYDNKQQASKTNLYLRPIVILMCCIVGFYAFRVIVLDYITGENDIDVYAASKRMEEGNFEQAEEILIQVLSKQPNYSTANRMLGFLYLQQDRFEE